ncbi:MAG: segregation and condensation protein A [Geothrix sp.]|nr:segregation/condensation protein A [Acidobacteriota bacterium]
MSETPQVTPGAEPEAEALPSAPKTFESPKGFETRFRDLPLHLAAFDGPLDLLLHLIHEQKLEILDLPMAEVTRQYMEYLHLMEELNLEIAAEFVAMAAQLLQIKSRLMLPRPPQAPEEDPRVSLVQRLLEYQQVKLAAQSLSERESDWQKIAFAPGIDLDDHKRVEEEPIRATLFDLLGAYRDALKRLLPPPPVEVRTQPKSLEQRVMEVLTELQDGLWKPFQGLMGQARTREELVLTFLALLELVRTGRISLVQGETFGEIRIKASEAA